MPRFSPAANHANGSFVRPEAYTHAAGASICMRQHALMRSVPCMRFHFIRRERDFSVARSRERRLHLQNSSRVCQELRLPAQNAQLLTGVDPHFVLLSRMLTTSKRVCEYVGVGSQLDPRHHCAHTHMWWSLQSLRRASAHSAFSQPNTC